VRRTPSTIIWVTLQQENFHRWKDAPEETAFLRESHRHVFNFEVSLEVMHDDREVEFFALKKYVNILVGKPEMWKNMSCEQIAKTVLVHLNAKYHDRYASVDVSEDGENGATVTMILP
jgi:hypothetical protein